MFDKITDRQAKAALTQDYTQKILAFKKATYFPQSSVPLGFMGMVLKCFRLVTAHSLNMTWPEFKAIKAITDNNYTLLDMGTILWVFQQRTQEELKMIDEEYSKFFDKHYEMIVQWQKIVSEEEERLATFLQDAELASHSGEYKKEKSIELPVSAE